MRLSRGLISVVIQTFTHHPLLPLVICTFFCEQNPTLETKHELNRPYYLTLFIKTYLFNHGDQ